MEKKHKASWMPVKRHFLKVSIIRKLFKEQMFWTQRLVTICWLNRCTNYNEYQLHWVSHCPFSSGQLHVNETQMDFLNIWLPNKIFYTSLCNVKNILTAMISDLLNLRSWLCLGNKAYQIVYRIWEEWMVKKIHDVDPTVHSTAIKKSVPC